MILISILFALITANEITLTNVATRRYLYDGDDGLWTVQDGPYASGWSRWTVVEREWYDEYKVVELRHTYSGQCLDCDARQNYRFTTGIRNAYSHKCNGGAFQRWLLIPLNQSRIKLRNMATMNDLAESRVIRGAVYTWDAQDSTFNQWFIKNESVV